MPALPRREYHDYMAVRAKPFARTGRWQFRVHLGLLLWSLVPFALGIDLHPMKQWSRALTENVPLWETWMRVSLVLMLLGGPLVFWHVLHRAWRSFPVATSVQARSSFLRKCLSLVVPVYNFFVAWRLTMGLRSAWEANLAAQPAEDRRGPVPSATGFKCLWALMAASGLLVVAFPGRSENTSHVLFSVLYLVSMTIQSAVIVDVCHCARSAPWYVES